MSVRVGRAGGEGGYDSSTAWASGSLTRLLTRSPACCLSLHSNGCAKAHIGP